MNPSLSKYTKWTPNGNLLFSFQILLLGVVLKKSVGVTFFDLFYLNTYDAPTVYVTLAPIHSNVRTRINDALDKCMHMHIHIHTCTHAHTHTHATRNMYAHLYSRRHTYECLWTHTQAAQSVFSIYNISNPSVTKFYKIQKNSEIFKISPGLGSLCNLLVPVNSFCWQCQNERAGGH